MTDIDDRKPHQILCVRSARYDAVIIRNELGMYPRFLTKGYNSLKSSVIFQRQSDRDLIQFALRQNDKQIIDRSKYFDAAV